MKWCAAGTIHWIDARSRVQPPHGHLAMHDARPFFGWHLPVPSRLWHSKATELLRGAQQQLQSAKAPGPCYQFDIIAPTWSKWLAVLSCPCPAARCRGVSPSSPTPAQRNLPAPKQTKQTNYGTLCDSPPGEREVALNQKRFQVASKDRWAAHAPGSKITA